MSKIKEDKDEYVTTNGSDYSQLLQKTKYPSERSSEGFP